MNMKTLALGLLVATGAAVGVAPSLRGNATVVANPVSRTQPQSIPKVEAVFVLDTTGSMSGMIEAAKEKIWSIATTMAQAQPTPEIRIGLVAYRDVGDAYVTQVTDLSANLDSMYATLMDFNAEGGGDGPESVNRALYDAVNGMSWSQDRSSYRVVFLVGDAPPHMDYQNDVAYPDIAAAAAAKGIVINTVQCGSIADTAAHWQRIAALGNGRYFQVEQAGGAVAIDTPYDAEIAELSARLDATRLFYGNSAERAAMEQKTAATEKLHERASVSARARRGAFNATPAGAANFVGERELVEDVASGRVDIESVPRAELPAALASLAPAEQRREIDAIAERRQSLRSKIAELAERRDAFIADELEAAGGADASLDLGIYEAVRTQAAAQGLTYESGPKF